SVFFFSSRRRHTRWPRDWSSDVCSSDLPNVSLVIPDRTTAEAKPRNSAWSGYKHSIAYLPVSVNGKFRACWPVDRPNELTDGRRSEERRVGKECRSWGWWKV